MPSRTFLGWGGRGYMHLRTMSPIGSVSCLSLVSFILQVAVQIVCAQGGPAGARVEAIAFHPAGISTLYVEIDRGGVFKSKDGGLPAKSFFRCDDAAYLVQCFPPQNLDSIESAPHIFAFMRFPL
jgi:hypothetical protein